MQKDYAKEIENLKKGNNTNSNSINFQDLKKKR